MHVYKLQKVQSYILFLISFITLSLGSLLHGKSFQRQLKLSAEQNLNNYFRKINPQEMWSRRLQSTDVILSDFKINPIQPAIVAQSSSYQVKFISSISITNSHTLLLEIPLQLGFLAGITCEVNNVFSPCMLIPISHQISITVLPLALNSVTITIKLDSLLNPSKTNPLSTTLTISLYQRGSNNLLASKSEKITILDSYQPAQSLTTIVQSTSNIVYESGVGMVFFIRLDIGLDAQGIITIIANKINVDLNTLPICLIDNSFMSCNLISYMGGTLINTTTLNSLKRAIPINLTILNIFRNSPTTEPVAQFSLKTSYNQYPIEIISSPVTPIITTPAQFIVFEVIRSNQQNSQGADYTFRLKQEAAFMSGVNTIVFSIPIVVNLIYAQCNSCSVNLVDNKVSYNLQLSASLISSPTGIFELILKNATNPPTTQSFTGFKASSMINFAFLYCYTQSSISLRNTVPSLFKTIQGIYSSMQYGATNTLHISFQVSTLTKYLIVTLPSTFSIQTAIVCTGVVGFTASCSVVTNQDGTINILIQDLTLNPVIKQFTLQSFVNPKSQVFDYTSVVGYSANNFIVERYNMGVWMVNCIMPCRLCSLSNPSQCTACYKNTVITLYNYFDDLTKTCKTQCLSSQYKDPVQYLCLKCAPECKQCETGVSKCSKCPDNRYLFSGDLSCLSNCPTKFYPNSVQWKCTPCQSPCITCTSQTQCSSCIPSYYLNNNRCTTECPTSVTIPDLPNQKCLPCDAVCGTCSITTDNCVSCSPDAVYYSGKCLGQCPAPLLVSLGLCVSDCDSVCVTCDKLASNCTSCDATMNFFTGSTKWRCLRNCPELYLSDTVNSLGKLIKVCILCSTLNIGCANCSSKTDCYNCNAGYILYDSSKCLNTILDGYANVSGIAQPCTGDCMTCLTFPFKCVTCKPPTVFHNSECVLECPISHYKSNGVCLRCINYCDTCQSSTYCYGCIEGKFLIEDTHVCSDVCPLKFYPNASLKLCKSCESPCLLCSSSTTCTSCQLGYFLLQQTCLLPTNCPSRYTAIVSSQKCQPCTDPCRQCVNSQTQCVNCINSYYFFSVSSSCISICPPGYVIDYFSQSCTNCSLPCLTCSQTDCYMCSNGYKLHNFMCILSCPSNYYAGIEATHPQNGTQCLLCPPQCIQCLNMTYCTTCNVLYWKLSEGQCILKCPPSHAILNYADRSCRICSTINCVACFSTDQCYKCIPKSILFNNTCINQCPTNYIQNNATMTCDYNPVPPSSNNTNETSTNSTTNQTEIVNQPIIITQISSPVPMIFTLSLVLITLITIFVKLRRPNIVFFGVLAGLIGAVETGCFGLSIYVHYLYASGYDGLYQTALLNPYNIVLMSCFGWWLLVNCIAVVLSLFILNPNRDTAYKIWYRRSKRWEICLSFSIHLLTFFNFKFQHLLYSNLSSPNIKLDSILKLRYLSLVSGLSVITVIGYEVCVVSLASVEPENRLFWIDVGVVALVGIIIALLALKRGVDFFEEINLELPMHKRIISSDYVYSKALNGQNWEDKHYEQFSRHNKESGQQLMSMYSFSSDRSRSIPLNSSSSVGSERLILKVHPSAQISKKGTQRSQFSEKLDMDNLFIINSPNARQKNQNTIKASKGVNEVSLQCSILTSGVVMSQSDNENYNNMPWTELGQQYVMDCEVDYDYRLGLHGSAMVNMGSIYDNSQQFYSEDQQISNMAQIGIDQSDLNKSYQADASNSMGSKNKMEEAEGQRMMIDNWLVLHLQQRQNPQQSNDRKMICNSQVNTNKPMKDQKEAVPKLLENQCIVQFDLGSYNRPNINKTTVRSQDQSHDNKNVGDKVFKKPDYPSSPRNLDVKSSSPREPFTRQIKSEMVSNRGLRPSQMYIKENQNRLGLGHLKTSKELDKQCSVDNKNQFSGESVRIPYNYKNTTLHNRISSSQVRHGLCKQGQQKEIAQSQNFQESHSQSSNQQDRKHANDIEGYKQLRNLHTEQYQNKPKQQNLYVDNQTSDNRREDSKYNSQQVLSMLQQDHSYEASELSNHLGSAQMSSQDQISESSYSEEQIDSEDQQCVQSQDISIISNSPNLSRYSQSQLENGKSLRSGYCESNGQKDRWMDLLQQGQIAINNDLKKSVVPIKGEKIDQNGSGISSISQKQSNNRLQRDDNELIQLCEDMKEKTINQINERSIESEPQDKRRSKNTQSINEQSKDQQYDIQNQQKIKESLHQNPNSFRERQRKSPLYTKERAKKAYNDMDGNQFRIKTTRKREQDNKIIYVDQKNYKKLLKRRRELERQDKNTERIKKDFEDSVIKDQVRGTSRDKHIQTYGKKQKQTQKFTRHATLQRIYLKKNFSPKKASPRKSPQQNKSFKSNSQVDGQ